MTASGVTPTPATEALGYRGGGAEGPLESFKD